MNINIIIGDKSFTASLLENETTKKFYDLLPVTVQMTELNRNEKYYRFPQNLPTDPSNPGTIRSGDLMLWQSDTLVVFYETFPTSYTYTGLGKIDDPKGLKEAMGKWDVVVVFEKIT